MSRGVRSDLNFFVFFCGLPAVKLFRRGLQSLKLLTGGPTTTSNYRSGPLTGAVRLLAKRICCQIGPFNAYLPERTSTVAVKTGPSKEKLLPKRALSDIHLPDRALTEAIRRALPKEIDAKAVPLATST